MTRPAGTAAGYDKKPASAVGFVVYAPARPQERRMRCATAVLSICVLFASARADAADLTAATSKGNCQLIARNAGKYNVVLSEIWLLEK